MIAMAGDASIRRVTMLPMFGTLHPLAAVRAGLGAARAPAA